MRVATFTSVLFTLAAVGCAGESPTGAARSLPAATARSQSSAMAQPTTASERWNVLMQQIVSRREFGPLGIPRTFALVSVAQYNAVIAAEQATSHTGAPDRSAAASGASAAVLEAIYPVEAPVIGAQLAADRAAFLLGGEKHTDFDAGALIGRDVAAAVLARGARDGSAAPWTGSLPVGPGLWTSAPLPARPVSPLWGQTRPWLMSSGSQFRPAPPPALGSEKFDAALAEVRSYADTRTPEQLAIARLWGNVVGTAGPVGYFGNVGMAIAAKHQYDERRTARMLAVMNMAAMDASIGCWDAKYFYSVARPFQLDPKITTPVGQPNFPSYPSAHSCFSAALAGVIVGMFPAEHDQLQALVIEAGVSRIYAGLHYRFDVSAGQEIGTNVARLAIARSPKERSAIPLN